MTSPLIQPLDSIKSALENYEYVKEALQEVLIEAQAKCEHPIIFKKEDRYNRIRLCPKCGLEEHSESGRYKGLENSDDRLFIETDSRIYEYRIPHNKIVHVE